MYFRGQECVGQWVEQTLPHLTSLDKDQLVGVYALSHCYYFKGAKKQTQNMVKKKKKWLKIVHGKLIEPDPKLEAPTRFCSIRKTQQLSELSTGLLWLKQTAKSNQDTQSMVHKAKQEEKAKEGQKEEDKQKQKVNRSDKNWLRPMEPWRWIDV